MFSTLDRPATYFPRTLMWCAGTLLLAAVTFSMAGEAQTGSGNTGQRAVLVPEDEPGVPLVVRGTVYRADGTTPVAGVRVYAYNTDATGVYSKDDDDREHSLEGWLVTDDNGTYELRTIKPGSYPGSRVPSHVHFVLTVPGGPEQRETLQFTDDPFISATRKRQAAEEGTFASIRPLGETEDGTLVCTFDIRLDR